MHNCRTMLFVYCGAFSLLLVGREKGSKEGTEMELIESGGKNCGEPVDYELSSCSRDSGKGIGVQSV